MRNHPKIKDWPPATGGSYGRGDVFPMPGEGTLHDVKLVPGFRNRSEHLLVAIEFQGRISSGEVFAADPDDHKVLPALLTELKKQIGSDMKDISDMQLEL
jgi:hypothetical protein